jgi:hypothetical protein
MIGPSKILVDKEKVIINGREAFRLFFYDEQEGYIIKVISYVAMEDIYLNDPAPKQAPAPLHPIDELQNAILNK